MNAAGQQLEAALVAAQARDNERSWLGTAFSSLEEMMSAVQRQQHELLPFGGRGGTNEMFEETSARLGGVEARLERLARAMRRTEALLAPLPAGALDAAAAQMQTRELRALHDGMEEQKREMDVIRSTKAYHHDLEQTRQQLVRFLFHGAGKVCCSSAPATGAHCPWTVK